MTETGSQLVDQTFWRLPLAARMARFAELREIGPFVPASYENPMAGVRESFHVTTRYAELVEISRRPQEFCSGQGAISIPDMPATRSADRRLPTLRSGQGAMSFESRVKSDASPGRGRLSRLWVGSRRRWR